jgi:hypothetical protein
VATNRKVAAQGDLDGRNGRGIERDVADLVFVSDAYTGDPKIAPAPRSPKMPTSPDPPAVNVPTGVSPSRRV